jgi:hypothetical protein
VSQNDIIIPRYENGRLNAGRLGDLITITVLVDNAEEVVAAGFTRIVLERSRNAGVTWEEITAPEDRPVLRKEQTTYRITDGAGNAGFDYRTRFVNTNLSCGTEGRLSEPSEPVPGVGILTTKIITPSQLRERYMFGIRTTDDTGTPMPDAAYQFYIIAAVRRIERELDLPILPQIFVENLDYYPADWKEWCTLNLSNYPLIDVEQVRVQYPSGQTIIVWPQEWLRIDKESGTVRVVPTSGSMSEILVAQGGMYMIAPQRNIPELFQVVYTAGFEEGCIPADILDVIGKAAALGPFNIFGDLITGAGIGNLSLSMDGISQSVTTTQSAMYGGYGSRILQYENDLKRQLPIMKNYYRRVAGMVVA